MPLNTFDKNSRLSNIKFHENEALKHKGKNDFKSRVEYDYNSKMAHLYSYCNEISERTRKSHYLDSVTAIKNKKL